ncbi:MAG: ATP-binding protein [Bacillota bacterium]|nr:ATP-binding protein [Bacillota bacterium]
MNRIILSPRWLEFQASLARLLKMTIAVIDPGGKMVALFNAFPLFFKLDRYPELFSEYNKFFETIMKSDGTDLQILEDPLGIPIAVIKIDGSFSLILAGGFEKGNPDSRLNFQTCLQEYGVTDELPAVVRTISRDDLKEKAKSVDLLYRRMLNSLKETTERERVMLLSLEEINRLMVYSLCLDHFDLRRILNFLASSLSILSEAEGAWVFSSNSSGETTTVSVGEKKGFLLQLEHEWLALVSRGEKNEISLGHLQKDRGTGDIIKELILRRGKSLASLGMINPQKVDVKMLLSSLAKHALTAVAISYYYKMLQQQVDKLLSTIGYGIIIIDKEGSAVIANRSALDILAAKQITLSLGEDFEGQGLGSFIETAVRSVIKNGDAFFQKRLVLGEGEGLIHLSWDLIPLLQEDVISGAILIFEDVTETVNMQGHKEDWERLATAGEVAAGLAHEIRNPMATAGAAIQLLKIVNDEGRRKELLKKISGELHRMNNILTDFLNLSKPKGKMILKPVQLHRVVEELEFLLESEAHLNNVELIAECSITEGFPPVIGDSNGLKQVILNIAKNAIEAVSPKGGRIEISLHRDDKNAWVSFRDNGAGIPREHLQSILKPFFTTKTGGTGLGLAISSAIVERMGGKLHIESELGQGTTVNVILPIEGLGDIP